MVNNKLGLGKCANLCHACLMKFVHGICLICPTLASNPWNPLLLQSSPLISPKRNNENEPSLLTFPFYQVKSLSQGNLIQWPKSIPIQWLRLKCTLKYTLFISLTHEKYFTHFHLSFLSSLFPTWKSKVTLIQKSINGKVTYFWTTPKSKTIKALGVTLSKVPKINTPSCQGKCYSLSPSYLWNGHACPLVEISWEYLPPGHQ